MAVAKKIKARETRGRKPKVSDAQIKKALTAGKSHIQIANQYDVSLTTIRRRFKELDIEVPDARKDRTSIRERKIMFLMPETIRKIDILASQTGELKGEVIDEAVDRYYQDLNQNNGAPDAEDKVEVEIMNNYPKVLWVLQNFAGSSPAEAMTFWRLIAKSGIKTHSPRTLAAALSRIYLHLGRHHDPPLLHRVNVNGKAYAYYKDKEMDQWKHEDLVDAFNIINRRLYAEEKGNVGFDDEPCPDEEGKTT